MAESKLSTSIPPDLDFDQPDQDIVRAEISKRQLSLVSSFETSKLEDGAVIYRGCFVPENRLLLCDEEEDKVYICDHDGLNAKTIDLGYFPCDVTLYDSNRALVSGGGGIQIIDMETLKPGRQIKIGTDCHAITGLNGKIWVRSVSRTLTMIDIKGKVQKKVTTSINPYLICLSKDGNIYCTDGNSNKIYVVTPGGKERVVYSSPDLRNAWGITVDDHSSVYIAGNDSNNIHRIYSDGKQSNIILTEEDGIKEPLGLSFNHQSKELMVINDSGKCVNVYKVS